MDTRIEQLCLMMQYITGVSRKECEKIILQTPTGKAVQENEITVMYEQQTENLYSIKCDLEELSFYREFANLFTVRRISDAMEKVLLGNPSVIRPQNITAYERRNSVLLNKQRNFLLQQQRRKAECL